MCTPAPPRVVPCRSGAAASVVAHGPGAGRCQDGGPLARGDTGRGRATRPLGSGSFHVKHGSCAHQRASRGDWSAPWWPEMHSVSRETRWLLRPTQLSTRFPRHFRKNSFRLVSRETCSSDMARPQKAFALHLRSCRQRSTSSLDEWLKPVQRGLRLPFPVQTDSVGGVVGIWPSARRTGPTHASQRRGQTFHRPAIGPSAWGICDSAGYKDSRLLSGSRSSVWASSP